MVIAAGMAKFVLFQIYYMITSGWVHGNLVMMGAISCRTVSFPQEAQNVYLHFSSLDWSHMKGTGKVSSLWTHE